MINVPKVIKSTYFSNIETICLTLTNTSRPSGLGLFSPAVETSFTSFGPKYLQRMRCKYSALACAVATEQESTFSKHLSSLPYPCRTIQKGAPVQEACAPVAVRAELPLGTLTPMLCFSLLHTNITLRITSQLHPPVDSNYTTSTFPPPSLLQYPAEPSSNLLSLQGHS